MKLSSTARMIIALVSAVVLGLLSSRLAPDATVTLSTVMQTIGKLWLNALQMTVVPLVGALVVLAISNAEHAAASGRMTRKALMVFLVLLFFSATLTAVLAPFLFNLAPRSEALMHALIGTGNTAAANTTAPAATDWFTNIIPTNAVAAAANGTMLSLVVFALFFGFALTRIEAARAARLMDVFQAVADTMIVIVRWVLVVAPIGVFALVFAVTAKTGLDMVSALAIYIAVSIALYILATLSMYVVVMLAGRDRVATFARSIVPAQAVAVSTQSSLASLPAMLHVAAKSLEHPLRVPSLVLPMAVSLFRLTSPVQYIVVASFIAWTQGVHLGPVQLLIAISLAVVVSLGSVGLPGQASFIATNMPITNAMGLPVEPLGVLLAVDTIPDVFATLGNVTGDLAATSVVAKGEGADASEADST
ncbi:dicarboxylate/amino acid:cation symporter [Lysobacter sp. HDW10]|uniref:dicarboxylate/amino acid:cation symporter n=1 Tax=Lysobacter sp. HDW10 TaxID=2714936 RepID=UPI001408A810|nr:dicarboxylate/amino acid:cation symporter [Lysobacter sp. HDW10]QIK81448.1 dicarboxylate/amino acid:cation symporter [Lysobacter sp. HDW10]